MDLAKYRSLFINETREHLQAMSQDILRLPESYSPQILDQLFRSAHSIKGMAASMGYEALKNVSHQLEDLLDAMKNRRPEADDATMTVLLQGIDLIGAMVGEIEKTGSSQMSIESFEQALESVRRRCEAETEPKLELIVNPRTDSQIETTSTGSGGEQKFLYKVEIRVSDDAVMPGARAMVALKRLEELGRISRSIPAVEAIAGGDFQKELTCYLVTGSTAGELREALKSLPDMAYIMIMPVDPYTRQHPPAEISHVKARESFRISSVRVETRQVDRVIEGLGELLMHSAQLQESFPDHSEISRLQALTQKVYDAGSDLRMLPFQVLSDTFPRIVYDLSKRLEKKVRFRVAGAEIRLDKSILDELAGPLIHLIRNALDHGIEQPSLRIVNGKEETGTIRLGVTRQGDRVFIQVEDDGRGLDPKLIKKTAIQKGLIDEKTADFLNLQEILMLITHPGFSTAGEVSDISGRGVGLDVVRARIDALGGTLKIYSAPGEFTRFDIILPCAIAILSALLVRLGEMIYAIPLSRIDRLLQIRKKDLHTTQGRSVLFSEDSATYCENLQALLSGTPSADFPDEFLAFVTEHQNRKIAWFVDELLAEKQILIQPLGEPLNLMGCYSGAAIIGKGEIIPVLDVEHLYRERYR